MKTWREMITTEMEYREDGWDNVQGVIFPCEEYIRGSESLLEGDLDYPFDAGFGLAEGTPFTLWTDDWVYFPLDYDGAETVSSVARGPGVVRYTPEHIKQVDRKYQ